MVQAVIQTTVTGLQGNPVATGTPAANQALAWNGTAWAASGPFLPLTGGILAAAAAQSVTLTINGTQAPPANATNSVFLSVQNLNTASGALSRIVTGQLMLQGTTDGTNVGGISGSNGSLANLNIFAATTTCTGNLVVTGICNISNTVTAASGFPTSTVAAVLQVGNSGIFNLSDGGTTFRSLGLASGYSIQYVIAGGNIRFVQNNTQTFNMDFAGNLTIAGSLTQGSDETTKTDIAAVSQGVSLVSQLLPKSFQRIQPEAPGITVPPATTQWGFMAQDVQPVIPTAVTQATNADGSPGLLSLDTTALLAAAVNAIKQLISRVQALESHDGITPTAAETA